MTKAFYQEEWGKRPMPEKYGKNRPLEIQALAILVLSQEYSEDISERRETITSKEKHSSKIYSSRFIMEIYKKLETKTSITNIYKSLQPLIEKKIVTRYYKNGKEFTLIKNKHNGLWHLNSSLETFIQVFKILFEYKDKSKPKKDPIVEILDSKYFFLHINYIKDLGIDFYNCESDSRVYPTTKEIKEEQKQIKETYLDYPEYFKYLALGKFRHNILQEIFDACGTPEAKDRERYLKTFLEIQTILNLPPETTYGELKSKKPLEYKRACLLRENLRYFIPEGYVIRNKRMEEEQKEN